MSDPRKELLQQIRAIRERMDPKLVERAKLAVFGKVPYDSDAAREAVGHFLDARADGGAFRAKLEQALKQEGVSPDLLPTSGDDPEPAPSTKPRRGGRLF